jgi:hypothetical protein
VVDPARWAPSFAGERIGCAAILNKAGLSGHRTTAVAKHKSAFGLVGRSMERSADQGARRLPGANAPGSRRCAERERKLGSLAPCRVGGSRCGSSQHQGHSKCEGLFGIQQLDTPRAEACPASIMSCGLLPRAQVAQGPPACSSAILRGAALHLTCKGAQQVRLLLQVIQSMLQYVANADHADQTIAFFHRQVPDVAGQHC